MLRYTDLARIILFDFFITPDGVECSEPNEPVAVMRLKTKTKTKTKLKERGNYPHLACT